MQRVFDERIRPTPHNHAGQSHAQRIGLDRSPLRCEMQPGQEDGQPQRGTRTFDLGTRTSNSRYSDNAISVPSANVALTRIANESSSACVVGTWLIVIRPAVAHCAPT